MSISVVVTGGAGYIGAHMVKMLIEAGHNVCVFDNLSRGFSDAVLVDDFIEGDLCRQDDLKRLFSGESFDVVMHFAALAYVGESVERPRQYYENNVGGTQNLLNAMLNAGVNKIVFSSTYATYGVPDQIPITEKCSQVPINPYGRTKLIVEGMLSDYAHAYDLNSISLRYFNAAGCDPSGTLGERHDPETHLIPLVLSEALRIRNGGNPEEATLRVFGDDFNNPDGTCIRDYIHVIDLCSAHMAAMERLCGKDEIGMEAYNLGNGSGFSVKEVIESCCRVTGIDVRYHVLPRRAGDPPMLVGSSGKARGILCWQPAYTSLDDIISTAWNWLTKTVYFDSSAA